LKIYKLLLLIVFASLIVALASGCSSKDAEAEEMLQLNWWEFDQSSDKGFRPYADRGEYARAAELIEYYVSHKEGLNQGQIGYSTFHAAVLCAYEDRYDHAIELLHHASVDSMPEGFPQSWNAVVKGTLGFMLKDMDAVRSAREDILAMPALSSRDSSFLTGIEHLIASEGMTYREATREEREQTHN